MKLIPKTKRPVDKRGPFFCLQENNKIGLETSNLTLIRGPSEVNKVDVIYNNIAITTSNTISKMVASQNVALENRNIVKPVVLTQ